MPAHPLSMTVQTRQPAGTPAGGQFAATARSESNLVLTGSTQDPGPAPTDIRPSDRSPEHTELAAAGVGEGRLSLLAPVEAKTLAAAVRESETTDHEQVRAYVQSYLRWRDLAETGPVHETRARRIVDEATRQYAAAKLGFADAQEAVKRGDRDADTRSIEAQDDLSAAVRRFDDARADLKYLTEPDWRTAPAESQSMADYFALDGARRRFADKTYRGQVH